MSMNKVIKKREKANQIKSISFETTAKPIGNSSHIILPKSLIGKKLKVTIEIID